MSTSADEAIYLVPPRVISLDQSLEFLAEDGCLEVTRASLHLRKEILQANRRTSQAV
jgi:GTP-binding protein